MKTKYIIIAIATITLIVTLVLSNMGKSYPRGGNIDARHACRQYLLALMIYTTNEDLIFNYSDLPQDSKDVVSGILNNNWNGKVDFYIKPKNIDLTLPKKEILIFCATPYNNVPDTIFFDPPFTHVVGYSDGTIGYIEPKEFQAIKKDVYIKLK